MTPAARYASTVRRVWRVRRDSGLPIPSSSVRLRAMCRSAGDCSFGIGQKIARPSVLVALLTVALALPAQGERPGTATAGDIDPASLAPAGDTVTWTTTAGVPGSAPG